MNQTITLDLDYSERLQRYSAIFSDNISPNQIMSEWSYYLEITVDQFAWQAIWKIPHQICEKYKITFPASALVYVDSICFEDLTASVKILTIQQGIKLPDSFTACLFHLWPTEDQDATICFNLKETTEALDNLRFFHKYLWRPWDDEDFGNDWFKKSLIPRLKLYYDLKQGVVSKNLRDIYRLQLRESKQKYLKFRRLQEELEDENQLDDLDLDLEPFDKDLPDKLHDLYKMIVEERRILELFENPVLREKAFNKNKNNESNESNFWLVIYTNGEFDDYVEFLQNVHAFFKYDGEFKTAKSLQDALNSASSNDTIFIGSGNHVVQSSRVFMEGGKIINVNYPKEAIITTTNEHLLFNFNNGEVVFQNLTFHLNTTQYGIRVRNGVTLKMENCTIRGYINDYAELGSLISTQDGIVADKGSTVHLSNCMLCCLGAVVSHNRGNITLRDCDIQDVRCVVRGHVELDICDVPSIEGCQFDRYVECIMHIEESEDDDMDQGEKEEEKEEEEMNGTDEAKLFGSSMEDDGTEDESQPVIIITKKKQFRPLEDIFSNPAFH